MERLSCLSRRVLLFLQTISFVPLNKEQLILPRGITGFTTVWGKSLPEVKRLEVETLLEGLCKAVPEYVEFHIGEPTQSDNYFTVGLIDAKKRFSSFIINAHHRYAAVIDGKKSEWLKLTFVDFPVQLSTYLNANGFVCVSPEMASVRLTSKILSKLDPVEKEQTRYWETKTVGDVVFNGYD